MLKLKTVERIWDRDGGFCLMALPYCNGEAQVADHRANRGMGGSKVLDNLANLVSCCSSCNTRKADAYGIVLLDLEDRGLYVRPGATHLATLRRVRDTSVEFLDGSRWYLTGWGTREPADQDPGF